MANGIIANDWPIMNRAGMGNYSLPSAGPSILPIHWEFNSLPIHWELKLPMPWQLNTLQCKFKFINLNVWVVIFVDIDGYILLLLAEERRKSITSSTR
jgi:hypothetical protein